MSFSMYSTDNRGSPISAPKRAYRNVLWGILTWKDLSLDIYCQYFAGSSWGGQGFWSIFQAIGAAKKSSRKVAVKFFDTQWPLGTVVGVYTAPREGIQKALRKLDLPIVTIRPFYFGGGVSTIDLDIMKALAPYGFIAELFIAGVYWNRVGVSVDTNMAGEEYVRYTVIEEAFGAPVCQYAFNSAPKGTSPYYIRLTLALKNEQGEYTPFEPLPVFFLYHTKKINANIYPAHGTMLSPGQQVHIIAEPIADRTLTEFTVQSEDKLTEATRVYTDVATKGITTPYGYDDPKKAKYTYGPVSSDVFVTAVAEGVEIEKPLPTGIPYTIQMTTTDCLVEANSWAIEGSDLPEAVTRSISVDGAISLFVPEDIYEEVPGGRFYIDVTFTGYAQEKALRVWVTLNPVPAYGTIWAAVATLPEIPVMVFEDSSGNVYVSSGTGIRKAGANLASFDEVTLTGTRTGAFGGIAEGPNGRLFLAETSYGTTANGRIWTKDPSENSFTRREDWEKFSSFWSCSPTWISAHPDSEIFLHGSNTSFGTMGHKIWARDTSTGASLHTVSLAEHGTFEGFSRPGVLQSDGTWLITIPGINGYTVLKYTPTVGFSTVLTGTVSTKSNNLLYKEYDGTVVLIGNKSSSQWFVRTSSDLGETWTDETLYAHGSSGQTFTTAYLKKNTLLLGGEDNRLVRSLDLLATFDTHGTFVNDIRWIHKRASGQILMITNASGATNVWKSEA